MPPAPPPIEPLDPPAEPDPDEPPEPPEPPLLWAKARPTLASNAVATSAPRAKRKVVDMTVSSCMLRASRSGSTTRLSAVNFVSRPTVPLKTPRRSPMLIGFDVGGTKIELIALADDGAVLARERTPTPRGDYAGGVRAIIDMVESVESRFGRAAGVGFGVPGSLSPATGLMRNANSTWLNGKPLKRDLEAALARPVRIENDANCLAVSEAVDGAAAGEAIVFAVILGTGCGAGVAIDGRALGGRNGVAGEFGHNPLPWNDGTDETPGPACWCGLRGCLETYLSGTGFARSYGARTGRPLRAEEIVERAGQGDVEATAELELYADRLARALASVANLLDPDVFVLGGGMSNVAALYEGLTARMGAYVFSDVYDTPVLPAAHGDSSGVRGAAWLWRDGA